MAKLHEKVLYFSDGADDCYAFPVANLVNIKNASSTTLDLNFHPGSVGGGADDVDQVRLTIADGSEKAVIKAITNAIADAYGEAMIVVADVENSVFLNSNITGTALTIAS
mgnify:FL=1